MIYIYSKPAAEMDKSLENRSRSELIAFSCCYHTAHVKHEATELQEELLSI